jgi:hypothetical protein
MDTQAVFFHKKTHDATDFLDNFLDEKLAIQFLLYNETYKTFNVKKVEPIPVSINVFTDCITDILKIRNI